MVCCHANYMTLCKHVFTRRNCKILFNHLNKVVGKLCDDKTLYRNNVRQVNAQTVRGTIMVSKILITQKANVPPTFLTKFASQIVQMPCEQVKQIQLNRENNSDMAAYFNNPARLLCSKLQLASLTFRI